MFRVLFLTGLLVATPARAGWFSYDNYDDCMLGRMKGQDTSMYVNADKLCKKQFGVEEYISSSDVEWSFGYSPAGHRIRIEKYPPEYAITKGEFLFSDKLCEGLKENDFRKPEMVNFKDGEAVIPALPDIKCGRAKSFRGKYK